MRQQQAEQEAWRAEQARKTQESAEAAQQARRHESTVEKDIGEIKSRMDLLSQSLSQLNLSQRFEAP